ncbi:unnamed protein product [Knipowitschia caucasica]|uniref:C2H2-type domain-containing protein n=1 Tax=Knipowitschia caucasica TaxID=637954 RepID=A0AAV2LJR6_KNICA
MSRRGIFTPVAEIEEVLEDSQLRVADISEACGMRSDHGSGLYSEGQLYTKVADVSGASDEEVYHGSGLDSDGQLDQKMADNSGASDVESDHSSELDSDERLDHNSGDGHAEGVVSRRPSPEELRGDHMNDALEDDSSSSIDRSSSPSSPDPAPQAPPAPPITDSPAQGDSDPKNSVTEDSSDEECPGGDPSSTHDRDAFPQPDSQSGKRRNAQLYECLTCGRVLSNNAGLRRHMVIHTGMRPHQCPVCGRGFTQRGNLNTHMKVHGEEKVKLALAQKKPTPTESLVRAHVCLECGMNFPDLKQLQEHRATHRKPFICKDCGKGYKTEMCFINHRLTLHTEGPWFPCSHCGKPWATMDLLKKHEQCHSKDKRFICTQCGKAFSRSVSLTAHKRRTHLGIIKQFLCTVCGKSFSESEALKVHLRKHSGETPYSCDICGKAFYRIQNFRKHMRVHSGAPKAPPTLPLGRPKVLQHDGLEA